MGTHSFEVYQPDTFVERVAQQVKQSSAVKFVHPQCNQVAFLAFTDLRVTSDILNSRINVIGGVVVELFVLPCKPTRLLR